MTNLRQLAALARVARDALETLTRRNGSPPTADIEPALALVEQFVRGAKVTKKAWKDVLKKAIVERDRYGVHGPEIEKDAMWIFTGIWRLADMASTGRDESSGVIKDLSNGRESGSYLERKAATSAELERALADCADISDAELTRPAPRRNVKADALFDASRMALGDHANVLARAARDPKLVVDEAKLRALLTKHGYTPYASVIAFDAAFGGVLLPASANGDWRETNDYALVGTYACLKANPELCDERRDLVPIVYAPPDAVLYLDAAGQAYLQDTAGDADIEPYSNSGVEALVKIASQLG